MINKTQARQNKLKIIDSKQVLVGDKVDLIMQLKALLPGVVNADNQLDIRALADVVDVANTTSNNQGYELTFAGKGIARALADVPTELELKAELGQSKDFDNSQNVVIRGDNLEVLKILQANYHKKIKMIYIDPPYNTKNENFIYKDNFKQSDADLIENFALDEDAKDFLHNVYGTRSHSGWLSFIYPRLKLARDLLSDDGVIFISIDDNEQANLKILCDEIFGEDNFIGNLPVIMNLKGNQDSFGFAETHENVISYAKNKKICTLNKFLIDNEELENGWKNDEYGLYKVADNLRATGVNAPRFKRPNLWYPIFLKQNKKEFYITENDMPLHKSDVVILPINPEGEELSWYWGKKTFNEKKYNLILKETINGWQFYRKQRPDLADIPTKKPKSFLYKPEYSTSGATTQLKTLFDKKIFNNPKPIFLIKDLTIIATNQNDIVLDFFAGSGTTGDAVMQLNAQDGGNRRFILVQIDEAINKKKNTEAHKFCTENNFQPVISSITIERLNRAGEKIKADFKQKTKDLFAEKTLPDIGYKVFSSTAKPKLVKENDNQQTAFSVNNQRGKTLDSLANMLIATCKTLDTKIDCLIEDKLYRAAGEIYLLANVERQILQKYQDCKINLDGWADIDLSAYLNLGVGQQDNISVVY